MAYDLRSSNAVEGFTHYVLAHLIVRCGCANVVEAQVALLKMVINALLYKQGLLDSNHLSDLEGAMACKVEWLKVIPNMPIDAEALQWWIEHARW